MPLPFASATATRFAAHWVADALAGDEALEFSAFKALVGASSESLAGAPEAMRERVALRCLHEVSSIAPGGDAAATPPGVLRVDDARSCEGLLLQLIEVGGSGNLEKDLLPPFSQDIQEVICTKKLTLPETSFQLLKEVDPGITSIAPPSPSKQNDTEQCDNDESLRSSHECVNMPMLHADNAELQQVTLANFVNERDSGNLQKDQTAPTSVLHEPSTSDSRSYVPPQEDDIDNAGLGAKSPESSPIVEGNISVGSMLASDGCETPFPGSINNAVPQQDTEDHTTPAESQSCRPKSPKLPHCVDGDSPHNGGTSKQPSKDPSHEGLSRQATVAPGFGRISDDALRTDATDHGHLPEFSTAKDASMISEPHSSETRLSALQHESGKKVNQDLENICANIQSVDKDHAHEDLTLQAACTLPSVSCNSAIQGGTSETNHLPGNATDNTLGFEEQNGDKSHPEDSGTNKANQALHNNGSISENNTIQDGLTAQPAPVPQNCNVTLHGKISEANSLSEKNTGKNGTDVQKHSCHTSIPSSAQDGDGHDAKKTSNKEKFTDTSPEMCAPSSVDNFQGTATATLLSMADKMFCSKDQDTNDTLEIFSQHELCIKCGKDGQLLKCSGCLLAAHDSCFGSSVALEETNPFYCPVCFYKKATEAYQKAKEAYCEARKNLAAFLGPAQVVKQRDEQLSGVQPGAANRDGRSNRCNMSKRKGIHQNEAYNLSHGEEEPHQQRKKQKPDARGNGYPEEVLTENVCFQKSGLAPMNKHPVVQNNSSKRVQDREREKQVEDKEAGNDDSSHETRDQSQKTCGPPPANQHAKADKEDDLTATNQSGDADEIEATSSNDTGKRSSPPWRNMRHSKSRLQETESMVSRKRNYAYPQKRYSNPVGPAGRRSKLCWTEEEEAFLREAMAKFTPQDDAPIPWVKILEYGSNVFHKTRLPSDLRVKWRNMKKKLAGE